MFGLTNPGTNYKLDVSGNLNCGEIYRNGTPISSTLSLFLPLTGGTTGLCVGHISPEAVDGGPIGLIKDGDQISIDIPNGTLELMVTPEELQERAKNFVPLQPRYTKGVLSKYVKLVGSATYGAVCS